METGKSIVALNDLCELARIHWFHDRPRSAVEAAWAAFDLDPSDREVKGLLVDLLRSFPSELTSERRSAFLRLLTDRQVEPDHLGAAGWHLVCGDQALAEDDLEDTAFKQLAGSFERDELAIALLRQAPVYSVVAERLLTRLRRWLLLSGEWRRHSSLVSALMVQATLNGGAWPFDETERARLDDVHRAPVAAYLPRPGVRKSVEVEEVDPVARAVRTQYESWPYPTWTRITLPKPTSLPDVVRKMCPRAAQNLPVNANILIAGCGTGRRAAIVASAYPDATVTAIDVSEASLEYARRQCKVLGIGDVLFQKLDLYNVARLGRRFDAISCAGVLHHLSDPERGLGALTDVLRPGGVMDIMVYSRFARLWIAGARSFIRDLVQQRVTDDLLREVRRRFLDRQDHPLTVEIMRSRDFATLAGTHDLLLHPHEDPFDVRRIERALKRFGLRLLSFQLPSPPYMARYDAMFPGDRKHRDFNSWHAFEMRNPGLFISMYGFLCSKD